MTGVSAAFLADFKACGSPTLRLLMGAPNKPLIVSDDEGFIGLLMPRRLIAGAAPESWTDFLAEKPEPKSRRKPKAVPA